MKTIIRKIIQENRVREVHDQSSIRPGALSADRYSICIIAYRRVASTAGSATSVSIRVFARVAGGARESAHQQRI